MSGSIEGVVTSFSDSTGWGTVTTSHGEEFGFHCIEITDGSRTIAPDTRVRFRLLPRLGTWQAGDIVAVWSAMRAHGD